MNTENKELTIEQQTVRDCPILYCMVHRPCTETTMCWGWEFGHGWDRNCQEMSYELETLNRMFYPKYRVRIQMDQLKEKFGYITAHYSIVTDHGGFLTSILGNVQRFVDFCLGHEFKVKYVVDVEPYDHDKTEEISKEEYEECLKEKYRCTNVEYSEDNGTYKRTIHLRNYGKKHPEPTKNRIWWYLGHGLEKMMWKLDYMFEKKDNSDTRRIISYLETKAEEIIRKTEEKCSETCEECGSRIGTEWSPTCETTGWITYICDRCAKKSEHNYYMNGKLYNKGEPVENSGNNQEK